MMDRGIIKWRPFDSCYASQTVIKNLVQEKSKVKMPYLSDDQINYISEKVIDSFNLKASVNLEYFYNGKIIKEFGKISNINKYEKKIYFNNKSIYLSQILKISF